MTSRSHQKQPNRDPSPLHNWRRQLFVGSRLRAPSHSAALSISCTTGHVSGPAPRALRLPQAMKATLTAFGSACPRLAACRAALLKICADTSVLQQRFPFSRKVCSPSQQGPLDLLFGRCRASHPLSLISIDAIHLQHSVHSPMPASGGILWFEASLFPSCPSPSGGPRVPEASKAHRDMALPDDAVPCHLVARTPPSQVISRPPLIRV